VSSRAISNPKHEIIDSNESSDSSGSSSGSRGRNDSLLLRNGRYKRVPTSDEQIQLQYNEREGHIEERLRNKSNENSNQPDRLEEAQELEMNNRETDVPAFVWDGAKLVPSDPRTLARRQGHLFSSFNILCDAT